MSWETISRSRTSDSDSIIPLVLRLILLSGMETFWPVIFLVSKNWLRPPSMREE